MTFEEALEKRKDFGDHYIESDIEMRVSVAPIDHDALIAFGIDFSIGKVRSDDDAKKYLSRNGGQRK